MATVQDLKRRIRSVGNTQKITKAFELVASARLRRAQTRIEALRPYADRMLELMAVTARASGSVRLPLLERREVRRVAVLPVTADRGLAGAFNAQILRRAFALERELRGEGLEVSWLAIGRRGRSSLAFRGYELVQSWQGFTERPEYSDAQAVAHTVAELYATASIIRVTSRIPPEFPTSPSGSAPVRSRSCVSSWRLRSNSAFRSAALATARATSSMSSNGFVR